MTRIQILKNDIYKNIESLPRRATNRSTGRDIIATSEPEIVGIKYNKDGSGTYYKSIDYIQYRTNLFTSVQLNDEIDHDILGFPRSSVSKYNLVLANSICLIDADYRGEIMLRFKYIWQPDDLLYVPTPDGNSTSISGLIVGKPNLEKIYNKGDTICQLKVTCVEDVKFELVDVLDSTERGSGGFGSTTENKKESVKINIPDHLVGLYEKSNILTPKKKYAELINEIKD
jgi:dUTPase